MLYQYTAQGENCQYFFTFIRAFAQPMIGKIIAANGTAGVDAVTGATHSSDGIKGAVEAALAAAL